MHSRRSLVPLILVGTMSLLALAAAILGFTTGPSNAAIDLQIAVSQTEAVSSFTFRLVDSSQPNCGKFATGIWQAPHKLQVSEPSCGGYSSSVTLAFGTTTSHRASSSDAVRPSSPWDIGPLNVDEIALGVPPLVTVATATNVIRRGSTYAFVVPMLTIPNGLDAISPQSRKARLSPPAVATDTPMTVVVKGGNVVSISFPMGIRGPRKRVLDPTVWHLSKFGTAPAIRRPR
jgi:hypothetical protein